MFQRRGAIFDATPQDPLPQLVHEADTPLYVLQSVFPFVLFTDKIIIRVNHIDIIMGIFFWSATSTRIQVQDIRQISLQFNPFFATLEIIPQGPNEQTIRVTFLWKRDAQKARRMIAGLMEANLQKVDFSKYKHAELIRAMEELGKAKET